MNIKYDICEMCKDAKQKIIINDHYSKIQHYLICKKCLKSINLCSKSKLKKVFYFSPLTISCPKKNSKCVSDLDLKFVWFSIFFMWKRLHPFFLGNLITKN